MREKRKKKQQQLTNSAVSAGGESLFLMFRMCIKGLNLDCQEILFHLQRWDSRNSSVFLCSNKMQTSRPLISKVVFGSLLHVTCNFVCVGEVTATTAGAVACHLLLSLLTRWNIHLIWQEETFFLSFLNAPVTSVPFTYSRERPACGVLLTAARQRRCESRPTEFPINIPPAPRKKKKKEWN